MALESKSARNGNGVLANLEKNKSKKIYKIIVIGDSNVGKTCLTYRFCEGKFPTRTEATIGVDFREKTLNIGCQEIKHPQCFAAKEYMEDLATIPDGVLQQANVQLVAVVPSMPELLSVFKEETGFRHALYCDPSANIYRKIGFKCGVVPHDQYPVNNKHVKSSWMLGVLRSTYRTAVLYRDFNADMLVNGGCLVLGPGRQLHCSHLDNGMFDQMPINSLLERVCGVTMSFPKDRRVLHL